MADSAKIDQIVRAINKQSRQIQKLRDEINALSERVASIEVQNRHSVGASVRRESHSVQTTESTGKAWKLTIAFGVCAILAGFGLLVSATGYGEAVLVLGVATVIAGKVGAWWYHG